MHFTNGFQVEQHRKELLQQNKLAQLRKTYSNKLPSISDKNSGKFWDQRFVETEGQLHPMENWRLHLVCSHVRPHSKVLDIGVGKGKLESLILQHHGQEVDLYATDITTATLNALKKKFPFWQFLKQKLYPLKFESNFFDTVFLLEVLEHIQPQHTFGLLREVYRVVKPGGRFVISVPVNEGLEEMFPENPNSHVRVYSEELLKFELEDVGFRIEKVTRLTAFPSQFLLKTLINTVFRLRAPNNLIFVCRKD